MICPNCQQEDIETQFDMVKAESYFSAQYDHDVDIFKYKCDRGHSLNIIDFISHPEK